MQIIFSLSETFKNASNFEQIEENLKKGINPPLVDMKDLKRFATTLPKQLVGTRNSISYHLTVIHILVDEDGNVLSAGGSRVSQMEMIEARKLACDAKFKPLILNQKTVKMTGTIMYGLY